MADKAAVIARIRQHYAERGIPLDDLSDRDIEQGVRQLAFAAREAGTGSEEAEAAMRVAVEAAKRAREERREAQRVEETAPGDEGETD
jgi:hypothetical protein